MKYNYKEIAALPEVFSLEELRVVCHISKRTARHYLQSGLIPCTNNGKKTHCYSIKKTDLLAALKDYEREPLKYAIPKELYIGKYHNGKIHTINYLPEGDVRSPAAESYYKQKLADEPDLLCVAQVSELTGYRSTAVNRWCNAKKLHCISMHPRTWITKVSLYEFMLSDDYNNIPHKSEQHIFDLTLIYKMNHKGG